MKVIQYLILVTFLVALVTPTRVSRADEGDDSPWGDILNPDGSIRWDQLTDLGTTSEPADWMDITLPGGMVIDLDATYHRYQTPNGNIVVLPSPVTLFFMAMNPVESGLSDAYSMLGNGASILAMLVGPVLDLGPACPAGEPGIHRSGGVLPGGDRRSGRYLVDHQPQLLFRNHDHVIR